MSGRKNNFLKVFLVSLVVFFSAFSSAASILDELHLNLQTTDGSGNVVTGTFDFQFDISTTSDCSNVIYTDSATLTTDSRGIISYYLSSASMNYDQQYYLCYYRDSVLIDTAKVARAPYAFRAKYVNVSGIQADSNLDLTGYNLSADYLIGDGQFIGNISGSQINNDLGWINVSSVNGSFIPYTGATQNVDLGLQNISTTGTGFFGFLGSLTSRVTQLFVQDINANGSGNISGDLNVGSGVLFVDSSSGQVGIGTTSPSAKLDVAGDVNVDGFVYSDICPEGMAYINKLGGYCIDKWEASRPDATGSSMGSDTSRAVSQQGVIPWVSISQINSRTACTNAGKHLCTDEEWLGAANVQGQMYYLPTNLAVAPYYCVTDSSTYCLDNSYSSGEACDTGTYSGGASGCYSAEGVYDMVGNVWEWTNETIDVTNPDGSAGWKYANQEGEWQSSTSGLWNKYGNDGVYFPTMTTGRAVLRGGYWYTGANAGPFSAGLNGAPTTTYSYIGFRCCV